MEKLYIPIVCALLFCIVNEIKAAPNIVFTDIPKNMQVCPRLPLTNYANVKIAGNISSPGYDLITVKVYRESVLQSPVLTQALVYSSANANFNLLPSIKAELANYDFTIAVVSGSTETVVATINDVVGGDVFLVNGQSNAIASRENGSSSANGNQGQFFRSFGTHNREPTIVTNDLNWHIAEGDNYFGVGAIGQWAIRMGRLIIEETGIPLAIINNGRGSQPIAYFQRNESDPEDVDTNYGRLLFRAKNAGVENNVKAILWHQGESDNGAADYHENGMTNLYNAWLEDYPGFEKVYIHQLRVGCGVDQWNVDLRNRQRLIPDKFPDIEVMSTTGEDGHQGCHFFYDEGHELLGEHNAAVLLRDLYGLSTITNIDPPNVDYIFFNDFGNTNITIVMRNEIDDLVWESGVEDYFRLENSSANIIGGKAVSNTVILQLNGDVMGNVGLTYSGHSGSGPWVLNGKGVGLLTFYREPVSYYSGLTTSVFEWANSVGELSVQPRNDDLAQAAGTTKSIVAGGMHSTWGDNQFDYMFNSPAYGDYGIGSSDSPGGTGVLLWDAPVGNYTSIVMHIDFAEAESVKEIRVFSLAADARLFNYGEVSYSISGSAPYTYLGAVSFGDWGDLTNNYVNANCLARLYNSETDVLATGVKSLEITMRGICDNWTWDFSKKIQAGGGSVINEIDVISVPEPITIYYLSFIIYYLSFIKKKI